MHPEIFSSFLLIAVIAGPSNVRAGFWDSIPLFSQLKSLVQSASGDEDGARQTRENFVNQAPVVSQAKSLLHAVFGEPEEAKRTQEQFMQEFMEPVAKNTPALKGAIQRSERILKGVTESTAAVVSGVARLLGGSPDAASNEISAGVDSAIKRQQWQYRPFGVVEYVSRDKRASEEEYDEWMGLSDSFLRL